MAKKKPDELDEKILDVDASMQGTITFKDPVNLRINGSFEGKLVTRGTLTIGENAKVKAQIQGDRIIVAGKITGDIIAAEGLSVIAPAVIQGNVTTPRLSMTEGAALEGQLTMLNLRQASEGEDVLLSLKDVAQYLEVETGVVEEWAKKNRIPARFENGEWIFSKSSVDRWIQEENVRV